MPRQMFFKFGAVIRSNGDLTHVKQIVAMCRHVVIMILFVIDIILRLIIYLGKLFGRAAQSAT